MNVMYFHVPLLGVKNYFFISAPYPTNVSTGSFTWSEYVSDIETSMYFDTETMKQQMSKDDIAAKPYQQHLAVGMGSVHVLDQLPPISFQRTLTNYYCEKVNYRFKEDSFEECMFYLSNY